MILLLIIIQLILFNNIMLSILNRIDYKFKNIHIKFL